MFSVTEQFGALSPSKDIGVPIILKIKFTGEA